jgi:hypothetical protein
LRGVENDKLLTEITGVVGLGPAICDPANKFLKQGIC